jgi:hypothetical protein
LKVGNAFDDAPPKLLMDSTSSPKVKTTEEGVGARSLALGVEGRARASGSRLERLTSNSITHTDLHKSNNKLGNV